MSQASVRKAGMSLDSRSRASDQLPERVALNPKQVCLAKLDHDRSETWPLYTALEQMLYFCWDK